MEFETNRYHRAREGSDVLNVLLFRRWFCLVDFGSYCFVIDLYRWRTADRIFSTLICVCCSSSPRCFSIGGKCLWEVEFQDMGRHWKETDESFNLLSAHYKWQVIARCSLVEKNYEFMTWIESFLRVTINVRDETWPMNFVYDWH